MFFRHKKIDKYVIQNLDLETIIVFYCCVPKKGKNVMILSTMLTQGDIDPNS